MASGRDDLNRAITPEELEAAKELLQYNKAITSSVTEYTNKRKELIKTESRLIKEKEDLDRIERELGKSSEKYLSANKQYLEAISRYKTEQAALNSVSKSKMLINKLNTSILAAYSGMGAIMSTFLIDAQRGFKTTNRELGITGQRSVILEDSLSSAASYAFKLGSSLEDMVKAQSAYSMELGRSVILSEENLKYITKISKGLNLSSEETGRLVGMMDNYGLSIEQSADFYEKTLKSSRDLGLNASKVVKVINDNLSKSQEYVFKGGVDGLRKMAQYSVKFKTDMTSVFNALDKAHNIEGAVDMVSNLQVIGGKFSQLDFHTVLYQARNDAEALGKTMMSLTEGMATFNKSTGEFEIQAGDLDRLKLAAQATGISYQDMIKNAKEVAKVKRLDEQLFGKGLSKGQKEFITSIASIDKNGKFTIDIGDGIIRDVRSLTTGQIKALQQTSSGLEQAAKDSLTFDESWKNLLNETKSLFLPLVKTLNKIVDVMNNDVVRGILKGAVLFGGGFFAFNKSISIFKKTMDFLSIGGSNKGFLGSLTDGLKKLISFKKGGGLLGGSGGSVSGGLSGDTPDMIERTGLASSGAWKNTLAFGAAMLMVGTAVYIASEGLSNLVEQFQYLSSDNAKQATLTVTALGTTLGVLGGLMLAAGAIGGVAAEGMLVFGGSILMIGSGIGIAAWGMSKLVESFGDFGDELNKNITGTLIDNIFKLSAGVAGLGLSVATFANPVTLLGLLGFSSALSSINDNIDESKFNSLMNAGNSMDQFKNALNDLNESKINKLLELTKNLNNVNGLASTLLKLNDVLSKTLKVEFKEDTVALNVDVYNEFGGQLLNKISRTIPVKIEENRRGI